MVLFEWNWTSAIVRIEKIKTKEKKRKFVRGKRGGVKSGK